jgi:hypothetical protein
MEGSTMAKKDQYNETSNTVAGINTPVDHEDTAATDMVSGAVEKIVDNIQEAFQGHKDGKKER